MPGDLGQWKARREMVKAAERHNALDDMMEDINPESEVVMSVSTATTERSFSARRRLKNYLRFTVTPEHRTYHYQVMSLLYI